MARGYRVAGGEAAAYEKLIAAMRHGQEACAELSTHQSRTAWNKVAILLQKVQLQVTEMQIGTQIRKSH